MRVNPVISVVIPVYNQAEYIDEALKSVLNQTFTDWECIIVNDGSTDDSEIIVKKWIERDDRFIYLKKENEGLSSARNSGIEIAKGLYILPLDADDKLGGDYLRLGLNAFNKNKELKVVYCLAEKFGKENGLWKLADFNLHNLSRKNMIFCSAIFKKLDWKLVNGYDENMVYGWEDWEFWISLLKNGGKVERIESIQFYYRIKKDSMLTKMDFEKSKKTSEYISIKHADFFVMKYGSFLALEHDMLKIKREFDLKLKSEKFIINMFTKKFFGFTFFRKMR